MQTRLSVFNFTIVMSHEILDETACKFIVSPSLPTDELISNESYTQLTAGLNVENHDHRSCTIKLIHNFISNACLSENVNPLTELRYITCDLKSHFCDNISKIELALKKQLQQQGEYSSAEQFLQENVDMLSCFYELINRLKACIRCIDIINANDILMNVVLVLLSTFEHCRKNEASYGTISSLNAHATKLFRKCNELQVTYLELLNILKIDGSEEQIQLFISILNKVIDVGVIVFDLEMKTMVQLWKGFVSVLKTYSSYLRDQFDISKVICFFCTQISTKIVNLYLESDKSRPLTLKILCFLLKIVVRICECFVDCLERCCCTLYELILSLYQNSKNCALQNGRNVEIAAEIEICLLAGVDPLVTALVNDRGFAKYFLECKPKSDAGVPVLLFLSIVLQKLALSSSEVQSFWFQNSVFDCVFRLVTEYQEELCYDVVVTAPISPQLPQEIFLYDALVVYSSNLIIWGMTSDDFCYLEKLLMYNLLKPSLVTKLFVSDLWCVIIRYGNTELRYKHTEYLITVLDLVQNEKPETMFLILLIKRFFTCLSRSQQIKIIELLKDRGDLLVELDYYCDLQLPEVVTNSAKAQIMERVQKLLGDEASVDVMKWIAILGDFGNNRMNLIIRTYIENFWRQMAEEIDSSTFIDCIPYLCSISTRRKLHTIAILQSIEEIISYESIFTALNILGYLRSLGQCIFDGNQEEFCCILASIFKTLHKNQNAIIRQKTVETFSFFSHVTRYEKIIEMTIANETIIAENMADYLQNRCTELRISISYPEFLKNLFQSKVTPITAEKTEAHEFAEQPSKKIKLDIDFENEIYKIESAAINLLHKLNNSELNLEQKQSLTKMLNTVDKLRTFL